MDIYVIYIKAVRTEIDKTLVKARAAGDDDGVARLKALDRIGADCLAHVRSGRLETNDAQPFNEAFSQLVKDRPDLEADLTPPQHKD